MKKKCLNCGKNFEAKRETAKFCSPKCRKQSQRLAGQVSVTKPEVSGTKVSVTGHFSGTNKVSGTNNSVPKVSVPKSNRSEHPNIANNGLEVREGYCHACGKKVANSICICYECFKKGHTHESLGIPLCETKETSNPNYKKLGLKKDEVIPYILWSLKKSGTTRNSSITVLNKTFNWGKNKTEVVKGQVEEFRHDMTQ